MGGSFVNCKLYSKQSTPTKKLGLIPFELWHGRTPSYHYLKIWGCLAKVLALLPKKTKLRARTMDCIFIGYVLNSSAYRFLVHKPEISDIHENMIIKNLEMLCSLKTSFHTNEKQIRLLGKEHMRWHSRTKAPRNRLLMRKLNQEEVRDLESQNLLVQIS